MSGRVIRLAASGDQTLTSWDTDTMDAGAVTAEVERILAEQRVTGGAVVVLTPEGPTRLDAGQFDPLTHPEVAIIPRLVGGAS